MAIERLPDPHSNVAKRQHIVPRTYMKPWSPDGERVWTYDRSETSPSIVSHRMMSVNYIRNTYDILPGDLFYTQDALNDIFGFLDGYEIEYDRKKLTSHEELNNNYKNFNSWVIIKPDGTSITETERIQIRDALKEARYPFTEKAWDAQYESDWRSFITDLERRLRSVKSAGKNEGADTITSDDLTKVMEYYLMFDFRSESRNAFVDSCLNDAINFFLSAIPPMKAAMNDPIPEKDRVHKDEDTHLKELRGNHYRKVFYDFLSSGAGNIKSTLDQYRKIFEIHFMLSDSIHPFITSNNPAFTHTYDNGTKENVFIALPTLAILMGKGNKTEFLISNANAQEVENVNKIVYQEGDELILPSDAFDISILKN